MKRRNLGGGGFVGGRKIMRLVLDKLSIRVLWDNQVMLVRQLYIPVWNLEKRTGLNLGIKESSEKT